MNMAITMDTFGKRIAWPAVIRLVVSLFIAFLFTVLGVGPAFAQTTYTFTQTSTGTINGNTTCSNPLVRNFSVSNSFTVADVNIGIYATHSWRGDLRFILQSPAGTRVRLTNGDTSTMSGDNFNVLLDDSASAQVGSDSPTGNHSTVTPPPYANTFRPDNALSAFNGQSSNGTWRLEICDLFPNQDDGVFRKANLYLTSPPSSYADLSLAKSMIGSAPANGGAVTWRLSVTNASSSPNTANGVAVTDTFPLGFAFVSSTDSSNFDPASGVWSVGTLAPGQTKTIDITGSISATAGAVITNTAEITASSQADLDSTVNNGATGEDDYASSTFTVAGTRSAGTPPVLYCPAGTSMFDWDSVTWSNGSTSNSYSVAEIGTVDFDIVTDGTWVNDAAFGGLSPTLSNINVGGFPGSQLSLHQYLDFDNIYESATTTITLPVAVPGVQFTVLDIDYAFNDFADKLTVYGTYDGMTVYPTLTNGVTNYVTGNVAIGDAGTDGINADGNVIVTFSDAVDTIHIVYGNHTTAPTVPDGQAIAIHDITFCKPYADLSVTKVSSVTSDPINGTNNPKRIPGALVEYLITVINSGVSATDADSIVITDDGPENAKICFDTGGTGVPVIFNDGLPTSGLTLGYVSLTDTGDSLEFSNDNGASWSYTPVPDADNCDANVTDFRLSPNGQFRASSSFSLRTSYRIR